MVFPRSRNNASRGAAAIEFAVALPFLLILCLGIVEIGRFAWFGIIVANAARAGAIYGSQSTQQAMDSAGIQAAAQADGANNLVTLTVTSNYPCYCFDGTNLTTSSTGTANCTASSTCSSGNINQYVTVTVTASLNSLLHFYRLPTSRSFTSTVSMRVQKQD